MQIQKLSSEFGRQLPDDFLHSYLWVGKALEAILLTHMELEWHLHLVWLHGHNLRHDGATLGSCARCRSLNAKCQFVRLP